MLIFNYLLMSYSINGYSCAFEMKDEDKADKVLLYKIHLCLYKKVRRIVGSQPTLLLFDAYVNILC